MNYCPYCGSALELFTEVLSLWQCPSDYTVYEVPDAHSNTQSDLQM